MNEREEMKMTNVTTELFTRDELKQNAIRNLRKINCYAPTEGHLKRRTP